MQTVQRVSITLKLKSLNRLTFGLALESLCKKNVFRQHNNILNYKVELVYLVWSRFYHDISLNVRIKFSGTKTRVGRGVGVCICKCLLKQFCQVCHRGEILLPVKLRPLPSFSSCCFKKSCVVFYPFFCSTVSTVQYSI